ncbi:MAG: hypothetical protein H6Q11_202 [Acidobacteria bacterium]|nr:hypothetical protein [Acidobacteriota bacterium]
MNAGAAILVLAVVALAGCAGGATPESTTAPPAGTTSSSTPAFATTSTTLLPADGVDAATLAAIVLFPEDLPPPYASLPLDPAGTGFRPAGASLSSALEPDDEADDIVRFGLLGDFTATYGTTAGLWVAVEAVAFADPAGAGGYLADWQEDLARGAADAAGESDLTSFLPSADETAGDEAVRARYALSRDDPDHPEVQGVVRVVRAGATLAWVWAVGDDPDAAADALGPLVEDRLLGVIGGNIPSRDPAALGLAAAPTELLSSFAFSYSYGIDTAGPTGGFTIEVTGEFRGPDRTSCLLAHTAGGEEAVLSRLVAIGTRVWLGGASGYQEVPLRHPSALTELPLCPGHPLFWQDTGFHRLPEGTGTLESLDGVPVLRIDLATDPATLEALGYPALRAARVTRYEVARAAYGGWVMEVEVDEETDLSDARRAFGLPYTPGDAALPATIFTRLRLSRPNDPAIQVNAPLAAG